MHDIMYAALAVLAGASLLALLNVALRQRRLSTGAQRERGTRTAGGYSRPVEDASPVDGGYPGERSGGFPRESGAGTYRVRPGQTAGPQWNPYAEEQSRVHRIQSARRKPRPARSGHGTSWGPAPPGSHYALLGVQVTASMDEIERAYRRYASAIHPDKFYRDPRRRTEAEMKMRELNAVMRVLRDPVRRARYDDSLRS